MTQEVKCNSNPDGSVDVIMTYPEGYCGLKFYKRPTMKQIAAKLIELGKGIEMAIKEGE